MPFARLKEKVEPGLEEEYKEARNKGMVTGNSYIVKSVKDYGWYRSLHLEGFRCGFDERLFDIIESENDVNAN